VRYARLHSVRSSRGVLAYTPPLRPAQTATALEPLREHRRRLPLPDAGQPVEPPRRPAVVDGHLPVLPARLQLTSVLQPVEALEHGPRPQAAVDRLRPPVPVIAREVGREGGEDLERREGDQLGRSGSMATTLYQIEDGAANGLTDGPPVIS
jgi:hypothetical protein